MVPCLTLSKTKEKLTSVLLIFELTLNLHKKSFRGSKLKFESLKLMKINMQ